MTLAPYGKMQKGAIINWTRHTNSSSFFFFARAEIFRVSFSSAWLFKLSEEECKTDDRPRKHMYLYVCQFSVSIF